MSVSPTHCPSPDVLERVAAGSAAPLPLDEHLASCDACRQTLQRIRDDNRFLSGFAVNGALPVPRAQAPQDVTIPGYEIVREVHRGGQGVVYQAVQRSTKRAVAIKVMKQGPFATHADRARFDREVATLGKLNHPNIVAVHDAGVTAGYYYFVMNFVDGKHLDEAILDADVWAANAEDASDATGAARGKIPQSRVAAAVRVFIKVCDAVHVAHLRGIIHRDLKPSNIRVDRMGEPHILDFGLAKSTEVDGESAMTRTGQFVGSLPWASPEQLEGESAKIDLRTDVYSLGVILFQLLTGELPFDVGSNLRSALDSILLREPPRPSSVLSAAHRPRLDDDLDTIVLKCLAKDPQRRYQSAGELARDARHYLAGEAIEAKRDSKWYVLRKTMRQHRREIALGVAGLTILLLALSSYAIYAVLTARAAADRLRAENEAERAANQSARAEALSLVLQSAETSRLEHPLWSGYPSFGLQRLDAQIRLGWLGDRRRLESTVAALLSTIQRERGAAQFAEELLRFTNVERSLEMGPSHPDTAGGLRDLAETLIVRHRFDEAAWYVRRAMAVDAAAHGEASLEAARDLEILARISLAQQNPEEALRLASQALAAHRASREFRADAAQVFETRARVALQLGRAADAQTDAIEALRIRLTVHPDEHPAVAAGLALLATTLPDDDGDARANMLAAPFAATTNAQIVAGLQRLAEDLAQFRAPPRSSVALDPAAVWIRVLALKEALLGPRHKGLITTLASLAAASLEREDHVACERWFARTAEVVETVLGPQSLALANCLESQAIELFESAQYSAALALSERSLAIWWALPDACRDDLQAAVNELALARNLAAFGRYQDAVQHAEHCIVVIQRLFGPRHHTAALARSVRAWSLQQLGQSDEAEPEARAAVALGENLKERMPANQRSWQRFFLGSILLARGEVAEAENLLLSCWFDPTDGRNYFGISACDRLADRLVDDLILIYQDRGDTDTARFWLQIRASGDYASIGRAPTP